MTRVARSTRRKNSRRRLLKRALVLVNVVLFVVLAALGGGYLYIRHQLNKIDRIDFSDPSVLESRDSGRPLTVLMVGSDSRDNLTGAEAQRMGQAELAGEKRSDTMMLLRADPSTGKASILSIPRDVWVSIDGHQDSRINSSFEYGGAELLTKTISENFGIPVNHYMEVDFVGFRNLVEAVGGVPFYFPTAARDRYSDLVVPNAGCTVLDGAQALGLVRSRHYEVYENGRYVELTGDDRDRILRQQDFIRRLISRVIDKGIWNPLKLDRIISIAVDNVSVDRKFGVDTMKTLALNFRDLSPDRVEMLTLPAQRYIGPHGEDALKVTADAQNVIDHFLGIESGEDLVLPATVRVRTLNGSGIGGVAQETDSALTGYGFLSAGFGNADSTIPRTTIRYGTGQLSAARTLQGYIAGGATLEADKSLTVNLELILGSTFSGTSDPSLSSDSLAEPTASEIANQAERVYGAVTSSTSSAASSSATTSVVGGSPNDKTASTTVLTPDQIKC